ncbi:MAG: hypothetical protein AB7N70_36300 [Dehalococcoidia bacterium]
MRTGVKRAAIAGAIAALLLLAAATEKRARFRTPTHGVARLASLFGVGFLESPSIAVAQESLLPDAAPAVGVGQDPMDAARAADEAVQQFKGRPLTVEPQKVMTSEEATQTLPTRLERMRERAERADAKALDAERPRWFEVPDVPEGVDAPPAPDAADGEITIQRLQEEVQ